MEDVRETGRGSLEMSARRELPPPFLMHKHKGAWNTFKKEENSEWWGTEADTNGVCGPWNSSSLLLVWFLNSLQLTPCTQAHANTHKPSRPHYLPVEAFLIHTVCSLRPRFSFPFEIEADTRGRRSVGRRSGGQTHGHTGSDWPAACRRKCFPWTKIY